MGFIETLKLFIMRVRGGVNGKDICADAHLLACHVSCYRTNIFSKIEHTDLPIIILI